MNAVTRSVDLGREPSNRGRFVVRRSIGAGGAGRGKAIRGLDRREFRTGVGLPAAGGRCGGCRYILAALVARGAVVTACEPDPAFFMNSCRSEPVRQTSPAHSNVGRGHSRGGGWLVQPFDVVVYSNVLDIEDDVGELRRITTALVPGGRDRACLSPRTQWLFGPLDTMVGHHRRYVRRTLTDVVERAGVDVVSCVSFDAARGRCPTGCSTGCSAARRSTVRRRTCSTASWCRVSRFVQRVVRRPPIGKNVVLIAQVPARRPGASGRSRAGA